MIAGKLVTVMILAGLAVFATTRPLMGQPAANQPAPAEALITSATNPRIMSDVNTTSTVYSAQERENQLGVSAVVRIYTGENWNYDKFDSRSCKIDDRDVLIPTAGLNPNCLLVMLAGDQTDTSVAQALGPMIHIMGLTPKSDEPSGIMKWIVPLWIQSEPGTPLADAVGQPIPADKLQLKLEIKPDRFPMGNRSGDANNRLPKHSLAIAFTPADFGLTGPAILPAVSRLYVEPWMVAWKIAHPDYGKMRIGALNPREGAVRLPLTKAGSPERARSIRGQVVGPDGKPIEDAMIEQEPRPVFTDAEGRFSYYFPHLEKEQAEHGLASMWVTITPPEGSDLVPCTTDIQVRQPAVIRLTRGDAFHTFKFRGKDGDVASPRMVLRYRKAGGGTASILPEERVRSGGLIPYGFYEGEFLPDRARGIRLRSVTVTKDSPRELVFEAMTSMPYTGRVVDGVTNQPLAGILVLSGDIRGVGRPFGELSAADWETLKSLPEKIDIEDKKLEPLKRIHAFDVITRTAADGTYRFNAPDPSKLISGARFILATGPGLLPMELHVDDPRDPQHAKPLPDMPMYAAARVVVRVTAKDTTEQLSVTPDWAIKTKDLPSWGSDVIELTKGHRESLGFENLAQPIGAELGQPLTFAVPASVPMRLWLKTRFKDAYSEAVIPDVMRLGPGETRDCGTLEFPHPIRFGVQVVDEAGQPCEGVALFARPGGEGPIRLTDAQGMYYLYGLPGTSINVTAAYNNLTNGDCEVQLETFAVPEKPGPALVFKFKIKPDLWKKIRENGPMPTH